MSNGHGGVILAGGKGSRLMPLTAKRPKPLLPILGKTPLEMGVEALTSYGITNIAVTTGYMWEEIENYSLPIGNITYYKEEKPMGTLGMIFQILKNMEEDFFVISGDCVFDFSLCEMMKFHKEKNAAVTIAAVPSYDPTDYGTIVCENGIITEFREKPSWKQVISTKINAGIYIINRSVLEKYGNGCSDFASEFFPILLSSGETIACFETNRYWCDMGTPESYRKCNMFFSDGQNVVGDYISISQQAHVEESVIMNGVKIGKGSKIYSSVIGEGVSIGRNCVIENAVIGPDSLICDDVVIEKNGIVGNDSIVSKGKRIKGAESRHYLFSDSGVIYLSTEETDKAAFIGKAIAGISGGREIYIFHDETHRSVSACNEIFENARSHGGKVSAPSFAFEALAAFSSNFKNSLSIYTETQKNGISLSIFEENGLPLSREEQLRMEKFIPSPPLIPQKAIPVFDVFSSYIENKSELLPPLNGICPDFVSSNSPSKVCGEIIKRKGGNYKFECFSEDVSEKDRISLCENKADSFFISESGTDVYCLTKEGEKLDKIRLLSIAVTYIPETDLPLPDFTPDGIKNLLMLSGGSFKLYSDSAEGRFKNHGLYSFNDGVSIVLGTLCASVLSGLSISEMQKKLPIFAFAEKIFISKGNKGKIYENLLATSERNKLSGVSYTSEKGKTSIIPQYKNAFKIFAESASSELAEELIAEAEKNLDLLSFEKSDGNTNR